MSKASQRKKTAFGEGRRDGRIGGGYRWIKHPYMSHYRAGYHVGKKQRLEEKKGKKAAEKYLQESKV